MSSFQQRSVTIVYLYFFFVTKFYVVDSIPQQVIGNNNAGQFQTTRLNNVAKSVGYKKCMTTSGQIGRCQPIDTCILSDLQQNYLKIFDYMCVIGKSSFGICCPDNVLVNRGPHFGTGDVEDNRNSVNGDNSDLVVNRGCGMTTRPYAKVQEERQAEAGEWPWMVAILRPGFPHVYCGGTLITDRHVLTAAHCLTEYKATDLIVRLGEYDFRAINETRARNFRVIEAKVHVDFDPITFDNDIAILRLDRPTIFTSYIWPICFPPAQNTWEGTQGIIIGWGTKFFGGPYSQVLLEVSVPIWKLDECQKSYVENMPDTVFCAGYKEGGRDACQGDSGGPLLVQLPNQRWIIVGVVSWGLRCGERDRPGIYTRVDKYIQWIGENSNM